MKTIAELVNDLFHEHRRPDGREQTNSEVARALNNQLSVQYLSKLRRGEIPNPGRNALLLLCQYFGVPSSYFFPELQIPSGSSAAISDPLSDSDVDDVLARQAAELPPEARRSLAELVRLLKGKRANNE